MVLEMSGGTEESENGIGGTESFGGTNGYINETGRNKEPV